MVKKIKVIKGRKQAQWVMLPIVPLVLAGGYFFPLIGLLVVALIIVFTIMALFRGRFYCGWFCGLGAFFERVVSKLSLNRPMLPLFTTSWIRWLMFVLMMTLLGSRLYMSGGNLEEIGSTFRMMWMVSLGFALFFGIVYKPRTWCTICPMGTMQGILSKNTYLLQLEKKKCKNCGLCCRSCPIETDPVFMELSGHIPSLNCIRCSNCVENCPEKALSFSQKWSG